MLWIPIISSSVLDVGMYIVHKRKSDHSSARSLCPGKAFADSNIFLLASHIIATMDLTRARDEMGQEIVPPLEFTSGFVRQARDCVFRRLPTHVNVLQPSKTVQMRLHS